MKKQVSIFISLLAICLSVCGSVAGEPAKATLPSVGYGRQMDVVYGYKDGLGLLLDVLTPSHKRNRAGILVINSGGYISRPSEFRGNEWQKRRPAIAELLRRGYVLFVAKHGSQPRYSLAEIRDDMPRAVRFIRHHASSFGIDSNRIGVIGESSGGHLSLLLATAAPGANSQATNDIDRESSRVQAVVGYYPAPNCVDFGKAGDPMEEYFKPFVPAVFNFQTWDEERGVFKRVEDPEQRRAILIDCSPISHVSRDDPPALILHGDQDYIPIQHSKAFWKRMQEVGADCELIVAAGQGHGWSPSIENEVESVTAWFDKWLLKEDTD